MGELPEDKWLNENKTPTKPFLALMNNLAVKVVEGGVADSTEEKLNAILDAALVAQDEFDGLAEGMTVFSSGALSGATVTVTHNLGTENIFWTINKTGQWALRSIEIVDENTLKISTNFSTTYSDIRVWALE